MSMASGPDPIEQLRAADPIDADDVPEASLARVSARTQEHIMTDTQRDGESRSRRPLAIGGAIALTGALALAIAFGSGLGVQAPGPVAVAPSPSSEPESSTDPGLAGGGGMASCIMYDPAILPTFEIVFDGTITAIDGDQLTFEVNEGWKGVGGSVTLTALDTSIALLGPTPDFEVGGRYLVTAAGSTVNACGYTLDYDAETATSWAAAFGG